MNLVLEPNSVSSPELLLDLLQVHAGDNVSEGKDHTLFALKPGIVVFHKNKYVRKVGF